MKEYREFDKVLYLDLELSDILAIYRTKKIPVNYSRSGYGKKLPTQYMIQTIDKKLHRVYCICYSNIGSLWINYKSKKPMIETAMLDYDIAHNVCNTDYQYI